MMRPRLALPWLGFVLVLVLLTGCGEQAKVRGTLRKVGPQILRTQILEECREGFASKAAQKVETAQWPESARAFNPVSLWAEPDGAYLLLDSDADGERGIYLPRILSEKDPLCTSQLTHEKFAEGVYWYDRKR